MKIELQPYICSTVCCLYPREWQSLRWKMSRTLVRSLVFVPSRSNANTYIAGVLKLFTLSLSRFHFFRYRVCHIFIVSLFGGIYSSLFARIFFYIYDYKTNNTYSEIRKFMGIIHWVRCTHTQTQAECCHLEHIKRICTRNRSNQNKKKIIYICTAKDTIECDRMNGKTKRDHMKQSEHHQHQQHWQKRQIWQRQRRGKKISTKWIKWGAIQLVNIIRKGL